MLILDKCTYRGGCENPQLYRQLCKNHYEYVKRNGLIDDYPKKQKSKNRLKKCKFQDCKTLAYGRGFCYEHWKDFKSKERIEYSKTRNLNTKDLPERKKQKNKAQATYRKSVKCKLRSFIRWKCKNNSNIVLFSEEQFDKFLQKKCEGCDKDIYNTTGLGVDIINKKQLITIENLKRICGLCSITKSTKSFNFIEHSKKQLRRYWKRNPHAIKAMQLAKTSEGKYTCAKCFKEFPQAQTEIDHIIPISRIDEPELTDLNIYAERLYCGIENLAVLCKEDHKLKTKKEHKERMLFRSNLKKKPIYKE